jgi:penicillin-binding protein 2
MAERTKDKKIKVLAIVVLIMMVILTGRLTFLQIIKGKDLAALADGNRFRLIPIQAPRGSMYDRNGVLMVTSRPAYTVSIVLLDLENTEEVASDLGKILGMEPESI